MNANNQEREILTAQDIHRVMQRMAHQIWEKDFSGDLALIGIRKRGATLAARLRPMIEAIAEHEIHFGVLDIGLYRDDIGRTAQIPELRSTDIPFDIEGKDIVLIDDVLFTGRTVRAALNALMDLGRPRRVQLLVLIDRGHRELPIQPDFVGEKIPAYMDEKIQLRLQEEDGRDGVFVVPSQESA